MQVNNGRNSELELPQADQEHGHGSSPDIGRCRSVDVALQEVGRTNY